MTAVSPPRLSRWIDKMIAQTDACRIRVLCGEKIDPDQSSPLSPSGFEAKKSSDGSEMIQSDLLQPSEFWSPLRLQLVGIVYPFSSPFTHHQRALLGR